MDLLCTYMLLHCTYILKIPAYNYSIYVITFVITQLALPLHLNSFLNRHNTHTHLTLILPESHLNVSSKSVSQYNLTKMSTLCLLFDGST